MANAMAATKESLSLTIALSIQGVPKKKQTQTIENNLMFEFQWPCTQI